MANKTKTEKSSPRNDNSKRAKPLVAGASYMGGKRPYQNGGKVSK